MIMIKTLSVKNFKSIKELGIDCKKINLFIGEPNTGKSNILEALSLLSWGSHQKPFKEYVRFQGIQNLFYDELLDQPVEVIVMMRTHDNIVGMNITFLHDSFYFNDGRKTWQMDYSGNSCVSDFSAQFSNIKFYRFVKMSSFPDKNPSSLMPPNGSNMFAVVMGNKRFRETMANFFKNFGFKLVLKPQERTFEIQKEIEDIAVAYPYILTSDTLQRIVFYVIAMESNQDSTLIFEEPEAHAFPYYTKYLGEKIAFDETNQYFIATHNPYLLLSILEKAPKESVNVFITYFRDYQTKVKCLTDSQLSELMNYDPFANLDSFIEEEKE